MEIRDRLYRNGVLPVVVLERAEDGAPLARALLAGGIDMMEVTLRTEAALGAIQAIRRDCPAMLVGAGTVLDLSQAQATVAAGAAFLVSPGWLPQVAAWCGWTAEEACGQPPAEEIAGAQAAGQLAATGARADSGQPGRQLRRADKMRRWPYIPGCVTPTEMLAARAAGLRLLKFFPARVYGGPAALADLAAPLYDLEFLPTGGVGPENLAEYLALPCVPAVGGSWLTPKTDVTAGAFPHITEMAKAAVACVERLRG